MVRDRDETETFENYVSRPSRDRDVETETTSLVMTLNSGTLSHTPVSTVKAERKEEMSRVTTTTTYITSTPAAIFQATRTGCLYLQFLPLFVPEDSLRGQLTQIFHSISISINMILRLSL